MKTLTVALILLSTTSKGIEITEGPRNITAYIGDSVTLPCKYTGTLAQPKWRIEQATYAPSNLPAGYEYTNEGLHIPSVWALLNNTVFVCFFTVHVGGGRLANVESQPGSITVRTERISPASMSGPNHTSTAERISPTLVSDFILDDTSIIHLISPTISPTLQLSPTDLAHAYNRLTSAAATISLTVDIEHSSQPSVSATPQESFEQILIFTPLVCGAASVVVFLLVCVIVIISLYFTIRTQRKHKPAKSTNKGPAEFNLQEEPMEPVYEEPATPFKLQENIAYKIPPYQIKVAENEAYGAI